MAEPGGDGVCHPHNAPGEYPDQFLDTKAPTRGMTAVL
jgi:hypothetical protein